MNMVSRQGVPPTTATPLRGGGKPLFPGSRSLQIVAAVVLYGAYTWVRRLTLRQAETLGTRVGPHWLGPLVVACMNKYSDLVGVRLASEGGEGLTMVEPSRKYMIVWHPHGFIAWTPAFIVGKMALAGHPHGREWFGLIAPALFNIPFFSEALMFCNGRGVSQRVVESLLSRGKGIAIQPGGLKEQIQTRHDQEQAFFPKNLGFIRMAIKYGLDLLPVYLFNENQLYERTPGYEAFTEFTHKTTGFGLPAIKGKFGIPWALLLPRATNIHVRWGAPVAFTGQPEDNPSDDRVEEYFLRYLEALLQVFYCHADECLPADVAAKGLKIIRLDGKLVPPFNAQPKIKLPVVASAHSRL